MIPKKIFLLALLFFSFFRFVAAEEAAPEINEDIPQPKKIVTVAIVRGAYSREFARFYDAMAMELEALMDESTQVIFDTSPQFSAGGDIKQLKQALMAALEDPTIDIIFTPSFMITQVATDPEIKLTKPVISGFIQKADFFGVKYSKDGKSIVPNLTYIVVPQGLQDDLTAFEKLVEFKEVVALIDDVIYATTPYIQQSAEILGQKLGFKIKIMPITSVEKTLSLLDDKTQAVYYTSLVTLSEDNYQKLIDGVNKKKIPSFALLGYDSVAQGVLAGLTPDLIPRLAKRTALNIQQVILGTSPNELTVFMPVTERLQINMETALKIDFEPDIKVITYSDLINEDKAINGEPLTIEEAMLYALHYNIDIAIDSEDVEIAKQNQRIILSHMLPQLNLNIKYNQIDEGRALAAGGLPPEKQKLAGFTITQMLFDDQIISQYRAAGKLLQKANYDREQLFLDIMEQAGNRFLDYLFAGMILQIQKENFKLVLENLILAKLRKEVGTSGMEDIYRWEIEEASKRATILALKTRMMQALSELNRFMGYDERKKWFPEYIPLDQGMMGYFSKELLPELNKQSKIERFLTFSINYSMQREPALKAYDQLIASQEILVQREVRSNYTPNIYASFELNHELGRHGLPPPPTVRKDTWSGQILMTVPIYDGFGGYFRTKKAIADLDQARLGQVKIAQLLEERVLNSIYAVESSLPRIRLTQVAVDKATANLMLVRGNYSAGIANLLDLIDAQTQSLQQQENAANAQIQYIRDVIGFQRSIAWFEFFKTEEERRGWLEEVKKALHSNVKQTSGPYFPDKNRKLCQ